MTFEEILSKSRRGIPLSKEDAIALLDTDTCSNAFYELLGEANRLSREEYGKKGYIFAQIGLNAAPCTGNCKFCSLAKDHFVVEHAEEKTLEQILEEVDRIHFEKVSSLFLMTTADYSRERFLEIGKAVRARIPANTELVANVGDFDLPYAKRLKETGFTGAYHIVRMAEGRDTDLPVEQRVATLNAIRDAGLELIYCVEPIGPEHTNEEIATEMLRAREYNVNIMACMRRVCVPGTKLAGAGEITETELTKIVAVTRLVTRPKRSMNVHEPMRMPMLAGVNQFYAEIGVNPRDTSASTEEHRGFGVDSVERMLNEAGYFCEA